jgi:hypothetical protein
MGMKDSNDLTGECLAGRELDIIDSSVSLASKSRYRSVDMGATQKLQRYAVGKIFMDPATPIV